jgi:hypothetical protein
MLESQIDQEERRRVLDNDRKVREGATMHAFAIADASTPRGRFTAEAHSSIVGQSADPWPKMPEGNPWAHDPVPKEEPLGYRIDDMDLPLEPVSPALPVAQGNSGDAPSPTPLCDVDASPPFPDNMAAQGKSQMSSSTSRGRSERSPVRRF